MNILERAKQLVRDMNPHEAQRHQAMRDPKASVQEWPEWAQRDFRLACDAMVAVRAQAISEGNAKSVQELQLFIATCSHDDTEFGAAVRNWVKENEHT